MIDQASILSFGRQQAIRQRWDLEVSFPGLSEEEQAFLPHVEAFNLTQPVISSSGIQVRLGFPIDPYLAYLLASDAYEHGDLDLLKHYLPLDSHVTVLGGGIGVVATAAALGSKNPVRVIEANPALLSKIHETAALNGVTLTVEQGLVSDQPGTQRLNLSEEFWASSAIENPYRSSHSIEVEGMSFAEAAKGADSMVIDIEGFEQRLDWETAPSLAHLFVEIHTPKIGTTGAAQVRNRLWKAGFEQVDARGLTEYWRR